jgi:pimeloyl-ACP methyl ester carboxylesterase
MTADELTRIVTAEDGRDLCVEVVGDGTSGTVLVCGGTPTPRVLAPLWVQDALRRGLRVVGYDRPGYGRSTSQPGHSVADGAADVRAIANDLGVDRLAVWGFSGGGPFALACAALLPDLVCGVATVGSIAPWGASGLDYFMGMGEDNVESINLELNDPVAARKKARQDWEEMVQVTPEQIAEAWKTLLSPVDEKVLTADFAGMVVNSIKDALAPGEQGWWDDGAAHLSPWGFELGVIRVPVKIWHGRHDRFVPFQHGEWLAANIPGAEATLSETDGHLSLLVDISYIHEWLSGHL